MHFSQLRANVQFRDGGSLEAAIGSIEARPAGGQWLLQAPFPPIEVIRWRCKLRDEVTGRPLLDATGTELLDQEERWYTLDNRRLYCLQKVSLLR